MILTPSTNQRRFTARRCSGSATRALRVFLFVVAASFLFSTTSFAQAEFQVIVHKDNPIEQISAKELDKIFLKRTKSWDKLWSGGPNIKPVNLENDSEVREAFSKDVHGRSASSIESYWQRQIFSGRGVPPDKLPDDASVIAYVAADAGAIGYVSVNADLPDTVHTIRITDDK